MNLPKVEFQQLNINENLESLVWYANPKNSINSPLNFYDFVLKLFPELKNKITENMSDEEIYIIIEQNIKPILEKIANNSNDIKKYQQIWNQVNDNIMKDLEKKLNIKWPQNTKIICRVGLLPVCPRDIEGRTFDINYGIDKDNLIATGIHELCHFLYFEKWKELYPNYKSEEFDTPHIAWYLSEAMIDPLINNKIFKKYTNDDLSSYSVFYKTYIDGKSIIAILREYTNKYPLEKAIKKSYELFKKYETTIKNNS